MEIKDILSYKQVKAFKDYAESCGVEYTGKKSQIQLISLWIDSIQIKQPQQSMSNPVKKKFTELEDKVDRMMNALESISQGHEISFNAKESTDVKEKWYQL